MLNETRGLNRPSIKIQSYRLTVVLEPIRELSRERHIV
jgi:hypothetical protein